MGSCWEKSGFIILETFEWTQFKIPESPKSKLLFAFEARNERWFLCSDTPEAQSGCITFSKKTNLIRSKWIKMYKKVLGASNSRAY